MTILLLSQGKRCKQLEMIKKLAISTMISN